MLTGKQIYDQYTKRKIYIDDFCPSRCNPNSYNLRLGRKIGIYVQEELDMKKQNPITEIEIPSEGYVLKPNELYLASTLEAIGTDHYVPMVEGRSSIGRLGIDIFANFGDVGFHGYWTLNISVKRPIRVYSGVEICQVYFLEVDEVGDLYRRDAKYNHNRGLQPSKLYLDFQKEPMMAR